MKDEMHIKIEVTGETNKEKARKLAAALTGIEVELLTTDIYPLARSYKSFQGASVQFQIVPIHNDIEVDDQVVLKNFRDAFGIGVVIKKEKHRLLIDWEKTDVTYCEYGWVEKIEAGGSNNGIDTNSH